MDFVHTPHMEVQTPIFATGTRALHAGTEGAGESAATSLVQPAGGQRMSWLEVGHGCCWETVFTCLLIVV